MKFRRAHARRGRRYPVAAPTGSVGPAGRLRNGARIARAAAMPLAAALNAPLPHGFSPVRPLQARTPPCAAALLAAPRVAHTGYRPPRSTIEVFIDEDFGAAGKAVVGCASAATLCGAEHRRAHGRARAARASTSDSRRLSEHSERSERSEFRRATVLRASQRSRPARPTATVGAHTGHRPPRRACVPNERFLTSSSPRTPPTHPARHRSNARTPA